MFSIKTGLLGQLIQLSSSVCMHKGIKFITVTCFAASQPANYCVGQCFGLGQHGGGGDNDDDGCLAEILVLPVIAPDHEPYCSGDVLSECCLFLEQAGR